MGRKAHCTRRSEMAKIRIINRRGTKQVDITVRDPEDVRTLMQILTKNDVTCIVHGGKDKEK